MIWKSRTVLIVWAGLLCWPAQGCSESATFDTDQTVDAVEDASDGWADSMADLGSDIGVDDADVVAADAAAETSDTRSSWECEEDEDCSTSTLPGECKVYTCSPENLCIAAQAGDGHPCIPEASCFESGTCVSGECIGEIEKNCDDGNQCSDGECDPASGECIISPHVGECDDGDACTENDECCDLECVGEPVVCDDQNDCTEDSCDPKVGCMFTDKAGSCDDGDDCTIEDTCIDGACAGQDAECECLEDEDCLAVLEANLCILDIGCNTDDVPYICVPAAIVECDETDSTCTVSVCLPDSGECVLGPANEGELCVEPLNCVEEGTCVEGECSGGPIDCEDGNPCTLDQCIPGTGCTSQAQVVPCDDGDECTVNDFCTDEGICVGQDVNCGPIPPLGMKLTALEFEEPGFCLPAPGGECADATALVNSFISDDIDSTDSPFVMLGLFDPFDLEGDSATFSLGPGQCTFDDADNPVSCGFTGQPTAIQPVTFHKDEPCQADTAPESAPPCFSVSGGVIEIGIMQIVVPVSDASVSGTFTGMPSPTGIVNGEIAAFLSKTTADAVKVSLPWMPAYQLSELLNPDGLIDLEGKQGWKLLMHFEAASVQFE